MGVIWPVGGMTLKRYKHIMETPNETLTEAELAEGWHFCWEWDGLLVHPGLPEADCCRCR